VEVNAARWGFRLENVTHLFVTHAHFDHASHAKALQQRGIKVVASHEAAEAMAAGDERCIGYAHHRVFEPCEADVVLGDGDDLAVDGLTMKCISAPGHSDDSVVWALDLDGESHWFVGDVLATKGTYSGLEVEPPWTGAPGFDRAKTLESAVKLTELRCDHVYPGHGHPGIGCGGALVQRLLNVRRMLWQ
jgi:glyoxylase-like metal-dependent hydrolase (beta-lactamase superfamily II)